MNNLDENYKDLLREILSKGSKSNNRTGTNSISIFGRQIRHNMKEGFPLLTTKKMYWNGIVTELLWFLKGDTNIKYLIDNNCHIWDGDAYKHFVNSYTPKNGEFILPPDEYITDEGELLSQNEFVNKIKTDSDFAKKWGDLGPIYGRQWRKWKSYTYEKTEQTFEDVSTTRAPFGIYGTRSLFSSKSIDQITNSLNLLKTDPDSRRNKVSAWNVSDLSEMTLPPCHTDFQFYTRELSELERLEIANSNHNWSEDVKQDYDRGIESNLIAYCNIHNIPKRAISLMWNQRSADLFLGVPFNIASYGLLLEIFGRMVNMVPEELIGNFGNIHLYENHIEQANEQISRKSYALSKIHINDEFWSMQFQEYIINSTDLDTLLKNIRIDDFQIKEYQYHPAIKAPLSN